MNTTRSTQLLAAGITGVALAVSGIAIPLSPAVAAYTTVSTFAELQAAFEAGGAVALVADLPPQTDGQALAVGAGKAVTLDLRGHALSVTTAVSYRPAIGVAVGSSLVIEDTVGTGTEAGTVVAEGGFRAPGIGGLGGGAGDVEVTGGRITARGNLDAAGIGGGAGEQTAGSLTISGGSVTALGGSAAAGVGGGIAGPGADVTVTGGVLLARGGSDEGPGIGAGRNPFGLPQSGGSLHVTGGAVEAYGGAFGAGVGGGAFTTGAVVSVEGGRLTAVGGQAGAGIGNGYLYDGENASSLTVTGGEVDATGGRWPERSASGAAVGGGADGPGIAVVVGEQGRLTLTGDRVLGAGTPRVRSPKPPGSFDNDGYVTVTSGSTWTLPETAPARSSGTLVMAGTLDGTGTLGNSGVIQVPDGGTVTGNGRTPGSVTVANHNFLLLFDSAGGPDTDPDPLLVYAGSVGDAGLALPTVSPPSGTVFTGWFTQPAGGSRVTSTTALATLAGPGPVDLPLHAQYGPPPAAADPTITATLSSAVPRNAAGWYRTPVTVTFTCRTAGAALAAPCPEPVQLVLSRAGRSVTRTITATDGGAATVTVSGIDIDRRRPTVRVGGRARADACSTRDPHHLVVGDRLSGVADCAVVRRSGAGRERMVVRVTDLAGNVRVERFPLRGRR